MPAKNRKVPESDGSSSSASSFIPSSLPVDNVRFLSSISTLVSRLESMGLGFTTFNGERDLFQTLGYPETITISDSRKRYRRGGLAKRLIDFFPREIWAGGISVYDNPEPDIVTKFQSNVESIFKRLSVVKQFKRADKLSRLGRYSILLMGVSDNRKLSEEMSQLSSPDQVIYLTPYAEDRAEIYELDKNSKSPRFGQPLLYKLKHGNEDSTGRKARKSSDIFIPDEIVHHSRVIHVTVDPLEDDLFSIPQLDPSWNDLDDLYKIMGGGSEAAWKQATQILHGKLDPNMQFDDDSIKELEDKFKEINHKLRRGLITQGTDIQVLSTQVASFSSNVDTKIDIIAGTQGIQKRILLGSERGELASSQDRQNKIDTISAMREEYAEPVCVRQFVDRLIKYGAVRKPVNDTYFVTWNSQEKLSEVEKAEAVKTLAEANKAQMEASGELIVSSDEIRDDILGKKPLEGNTLNIGDTEEVNLTDSSLNLSVSSDINTISKIVDRNVSTLASDIIDHFASLSISESDLDSIDSFDFKEDDLASTLSDRFLSVMLQASKPESKKIKSRISSSNDMRFSAVTVKLDITNPRAVEYAQDKSSQLIKEILPDTRKGVQEYIAKSIEEGVTPNKISQSIRSIVGLRSDQIQAIFNLKDELRAAKPGSLVTRFPADGKNRDLPGLRIKIHKEGASEEWIESKAARYAEMQLNYRGRLIARTELAGAANEGLRETWRQSMENGYLPEDIKRIWIANTDRHADMDGQVTGIDESFTPAIEPGQEPNCGCTQGLTEEKK